VELNVARLRGDKGLLQLLMLVTALAQELWRETRMAIIYA
jgi:hypothetical protein